MIPPLRTWEKSYRKWRHRLPSRTTLKNRGLDRSRTSTRNFPTYRISASSRQTTCRKHRTRTRSSSRRFSNWAVGMASSSHHRSGGRSASTSNQRLLPRRRQSPKLIRHKMTCKSLQLKSKTLSSRYKPWRLRTSCSSLKWTSSRVETPRNNQIWLSETWCFHCTVHRRLSRCTSKKEIKSEKTSYTVK